jgi:hypothetical protein
VQLVGVYVRSCILITKFRLASPLKMLAVDSLQPGRVMLLILNATPFQVIDERGKQDSVVRL